MPKLHCRCRLRVTVPLSLRLHGLFSIISLTAKMGLPVTHSLSLAMLKVGEALHRVSDLELLSLFHSRIYPLKTRWAESLLLSRNKMDLQTSKEEIQLVTKLLRTLLKIKKLKMKKLNSMMKSTLSIIWTILKEMTKMTGNHSFLRKNYD